MQVSVVITILNEEANLNLLLSALKQQTFRPTEIIIVDGGSSDKSLEILASWQQHNFFKKILKVITKEGNRSVGRNIAIKQAKSDWIAITDAGCIPDKNWLKELVVNQEKNKSEVVAGYYYGEANSSFEAAVIPYVLVMTDRVDANGLLPAPRSMLIKKSVWTEIGGFDESLAHNEDYVFAHKLKECVVKMSFAKKAFVAWMPRKNLGSFMKMIFRFAYGDLEANILRPKVVLVLVRYLVLVFYLLMLLALFSFGSIYLFIFKTALFILAINIFIYFSWSIQKNVKYVKRGWWWLPILQLTADVAVITGTLSGMMKRSE